VLRLFASLLMRHGYRDQAKRWLGYAEWVDSLHWRLNRR
jgi:hypothetical protein